MAAAALAEQSGNLALIAYFRLQIEKLNRDRFGPRSERTTRLLDQMELQLEELEASATEDELAAEAAAARTIHVAGFTRTRPARRPFPEHLPRQRVVVPGPAACACGGTRLSRLGEDITDEVPPVWWTPMMPSREVIFEPSAQAIRNWVTQADRQEGRREPKRAVLDAPLTPAKREELARLRRENKQLRLERDILPRAAAWSACETGAVPSGSSGS